MRFWVTFRLSRGVVVGHVLSYLITYHDFRSSSTHLLNCALAITWIYINCTHRVLKSLHFKPIFQRLKHSVLNTIVRGQSTDPHLLNTLPFQLRCEIGFIEGGVAVCVAETFRDNSDTWILAQPRMKFSAGCVLHTMNRPGTPERCEMLRLCWMPVA